MYNGSRGTIAGYWGESNLCIKNSFAVWKMLLEFIVSTTPAFLVWGLIVHASLLHEFTGNILLRKPNDTVKEGIRLQIRKSEAWNGLGVPQHLKIFQSLFLIVLSINRVIWDRFKYRVYKWSQTHFPGRWVMLLWSQQ